MRISIGRVTAVAALLSLGCSSSSTEPVAVDVADSATDVQADTSPGYPPGPYGVALHETIPDLEWDGYRDAGGEWTKIHMHDYYDPDGSRGIRGVQLDIATGALTGECGWCEEFSANLAQWNERVRERGGRLVDVLVKAPTEGSTQAFVDGWVKKRKLNFDVVADPLQLSITEPNGTRVPDGLPRELVIDPRSMKIMKVFVGVDPGVRYPCATSDDCCKVGGSRPGIDRQGASGMGQYFCTSVDYVCSELYAHTCVHPSRGSPVPDLEKVLVANGAAPLTPAADAGTD